MGLKKEGVNRVITDNFETVHLADSNTKKLILKSVKDAGRWNSDIFRLAKMDY
jgi:hypothetical protein